MESAQCRERSSQKEQRNKRKTPSTPVSTQPLTLYVGDGRGGRAAAHRPRASEGSPWLWSYSSLSSPMITSRVTQPPPPRQDANREPAVVPCYCGASTSRRTPRAGLPAPTEVSRARRAARVASTPVAVGSPEPARHLRPPPDLDTLNIPTADPLSFRG